VYKIFQGQRHSCTQKDNVVMGGVVMRWPLKCAFVVWFNIYFVK